MDPPDWKTNQDDEKSDPMQSHLQKSIIKSIVSGARATLNEPSRPFTPADLDRHLFSGNDYSERPGSAYKVGQVANDAIENFTRSSTAESGAKPIQPLRPGSRSRGTKLQPIVRNKEQPKKLNKVILKKNLPGTAPKSLNTFKGNKPIKVLKINNNNESVIEPTPEELNLKDCEIGKANIYKNQQDAYQQQTELMQSMKKAKFDYDINIEAAEEDDMEQYFMETMNKDLENSITGDVKDQYTEALEKLEEIKKNQHPTQVHHDLTTDQAKDFHEPEDDMEKRLVDDISQSLKEEAKDSSEGLDTKNKFQIEYEELIQEFSYAINSKERKVLGLTKVTEISDRVWGLIDDWRNQDPRVIEKCYKETLLKGILSLIDNKNAISVFKLCKCCIHIINSIFNEKCRLSEQDRVNDETFLKLFNSLLSVIKIIFKYSKGKEYDKLFESEQIYDDMLHIITTYYIEGRSILDQLTKKVIKKVNSDNVEIKNTNATFDLLIYIVGLLKNSSISKENQNLLHNKSAIQHLTKLCKTVLNEEEINNSKIPQLFVQVTGCFRNLAMNPQQIEIFIQEGALVALSQILSSFKEHKELSFNTVRILSKISLNYEALDVMNMFGNEFIDALSQVMLNNVSSSSILVRSAFVLGNLTTVYQDSRLSLLKDGRFLTNLLKISDELFKNDAKKKPTSNKKMDFNRDNTEDALTKTIRLIANLLTEPNCKKLIEINKPKVDRFFSNSMNALKTKTLEKNEECILNIVACFTNFLFYDTNEFSIFTDKNAEIIRQDCIKRIGMYLFESDNEELRIETMRVLCNLSRNNECCELIVDAETLLKTLVDMLESEIRDIKFYDIGLLINICLNSKGRKIVTKLCLDKIVEILRDSNIEDMDLSKVAAKALISFCEEKHRWGNESIQAADDVCTEIGEELDSIMDVASDEEKEILMQLRYLINQVINNLPEIMYSCGIDNCGRKFKTKDELEEHKTRRHNA